MLSITRVFKSLGLLADAIAMLAGTISTADARLREQLRLDGDSGPKVLDGTSGQPVAERAADATPEPAVNGRKSRSRAAANE